MGITIIFFPVLATFMLLGVYRVVRVLMLREDKSVLSGSVFKRHRRLQVRSSVVFLSATAAALACSLLLSAISVQVSTACIVVLGLFVGGAAVSAFFGSQAESLRKNAVAALASDGGSTAEVTGAPGDAFGAGSSTGAQALGSASNGLKVFFWAVTALILLYGLVQTSAVVASGAVLPAIIAVILPGKKKVR